MCGYSFDTAAALEAEHAATKVMFQPPTTGIRVVSYGQGKQISEAGIDLGSPFKPPQVRARNHDGCFFSS